MPTTAKTLKGRQVARSAKTGKFVTKVEAKRKPKTTVVEMVDKPRRRRKR